MSKWVTRERAKVDRVACPWLIRRFIDADAEFLFVPKERVGDVAAETGATPFDAPGVELNHYVEEGVEYVSFDAVIRKFHLNDPALDELAKIVRSADGGGPVDAPEGPGLAAAADGFRENASDDQENLRIQFPLYDALYAYCKKKVESAVPAGAAGERVSLEPASEQVLAPDPAAPATLSDEPAELTLNAPDSSSPASLSVDAVAPESSEPELLAPELPAPEPWTETAVDGDFRHLERRAWTDSAVAATYAELWTPVVRKAVGPLLRAAGVEAGLDTLDVACGPGPVTLACREADARVVSVDFSGAMLALVLGVAPDAEVVRASAERLPFRDGEFDRLVCNLGLLHFPSPERAIAEAARVLRPGGRAAWSVWGSDSDLMQIVPDAIEELDLHPELPEAPGFFRFSDPMVFAAALRDGGLDPAPTVRLEWKASIPSVDVFWKMIREGSARSRAALTALSEEDQAKVRELAAEYLEEYQSPHGFSVPASIVIGAGTKA